MPAFTEEEKRILLQTPIKLILSHFGKATEHSRGNMFYSPFRDECTPSFHINPNNNTWYDFGTGEGGGIIDIVTRLAGCSRSQAYDFLASMRKDFVALSQYNLPKGKKIANRIDIISSKSGFRNRSLISYAEERGISLETLESFCTEVIYSIDGIRGRQFYAIGFRNDSGGYVLRSRFTKKCTSNDLSTLKCIPENDRNSVAVFEGFFDFLSWYEDNGYCTLPCDVCILNSVVNAERSLDSLKGHNNIFIYFDNDNAGKKATQSIIEKTKAKYILVQDMSGTYSGYMEKKSLMRLIAVTAVICTGYTCYAQIDTIRISTSFTTHVIFTSDLSYVDLSNSRIVAAKIIDQNKNILALKARDRFTENTSVSALESDGTMHTFIIVYEESPSELVLDLRSMILEKTDREQRHGKPDRTVPDMKEFMSGKQRLFHIGDRKYRLTALCEDIVQTNDATYVVLSLRNSSSTGFTTSDATFVIEDRKRHKRAVRIEKSIFPSTSFGSLSATGGAFSKAVYSFDKLTISKDQVLKIYIYEEGGQRNLEMTISAKEINR